MKKIIITLILFFYIITSNTIISKEIKLEYDPNEGLKFEYILIKDKKSFGNTIEFNKLDKNTMKYLNFNIHNIPEGKYTLIDEDDLKLISKWQILASKENEIKIKTITETKYVYIDKYSNFEIILFFIGTLAMGILGTSLYYKLK